jgi:hypothetical protein
VGGERRGPGKYLYLFLADLILTAGKSLACFNRLIREHPASPLREEAKIWVSLLETMEKTKQVDLDLEEKKKALNK